ncbi:hypothetical protein FEF65_10645 [Mariprofundus erugo]|uniref:CENP-V/GFA domain-containing protein n=2 Tax=Mariprofundus erugo TaxID=2528639 RepID=A0A5R9GPR2_9PROT|nr:hypothetical protein FEF65_10645 [Mariprofundus erugo]
MMSGSCLCGRVRYEVRGRTGEITHCHCPICRKAHAAAFSTLLPVDAAGFMLTDGAHWLGRYAPEAGQTRFFCSQCGSQLYVTYEQQEQILLCVGTLDTDPGIRPVCHVHTSRKAGWYTIRDDIPLFPGRRSLAVEAAAEAVGLERCYHQMQQMLLQASRQETVTSLLLLWAGAEKIVPLERDIKKNIRTSDRMECLPDSRFAILLPYTGANAARILGERIRNSAKIDAFDSSLKIGMATRLPEPVDMADIMSVIDTMFVEAERGMMQHVVAMP